MNNTKNSIFLPERKTDLRLQIARRSISTATGIENEMSQFEKELFFSYSIGLYKNQKCQSKSYKWYICWNKWSEIGIER